MQINDADNKLKLRKETYTRFKNYKLTILVCVCKC